MTSLTAQAVASPTRVAPASLTPLDLDTADAGQLAREWAEASPQPQLLVDCGRLQLLRTRGVSHVVSQLLELRRRGGSVWLSNVPPVLARCLQLLRVDQLFPVVQ